MLEQRDVADFDVAYFLDEKRLSHLSEVFYEIQLELSPGHGDDKNS